MTYCFFPKYQGGNCLILKFKEKLWFTQNIKDEKCFNPKFVWVCVCETMCFYVKWCIKKKKLQKINLTNKKLFLETQRMAQHFHNAFMTLLYFTLTCK